MPLPPTSLETPCREWQGGKNGAGYGRLKREGRMWFVHRWVWTLANGPIPKGIKVLHRCDNPPCFRLDHLFLGDQAQNIADMTSKGRQRTNGFEHRQRCPQGHEHDALRNGHRICKTCQREATRRYRARKRA